MRVCSEVVVNLVNLSCAGSGVEKPIGEAILQIDMMLGKERKVNVRGENLKLKILHAVQTGPLIKWSSATSPLLASCTVFLRVIVQNRGVLKGLVDETRQHDLPDNIKASNVTSSSAPSHCSQRHEVADIGDVPAFRGSLHGRPLPGRQEAQVHHKVQEQQLVGKVQRGLPVVSFSTNWRTILGEIVASHRLYILLCPVVFWVRSPQTATSCRWRWRTTALAGRTGWSAWPWSSCATSPTERAACAGVPWGRAFRPTRRAWRWCASCPSGPQTRWQRSLSRWSLRFALRRRADERRRPTGWKCRQTRSRSVLRFRSGVYKRCRQNTEVTHAKNFWLDIGIEKWKARWLFVTLVRITHQLECRIWGHNEQLF